MMMPEATAHEDFEGHIIFKIGCDAFLAPESKIIDVSAMMNAIRKRLVIDLDGTLTIDDPAREYANKEPNPIVVAKLREYKAAGFEIVIHSARNMRTYGNSLGKINANTLPAMVDWLHRHEIPYDEIYVGKPWCGTDGFYVDDRAIRPDEFATMSLEEVLALLDEPRVT